MTTNASMHNTVSREYHEAHVREILDEKEMLIERGEEKTKRIQGLIMTYSSDMTSVQDELEDAVNCGWISKDALIIIIEGLNNRIKDYEFGHMMSKFEVTWKETYGVTVSRSEEIEARDEAHAMEIVKEDHVHELEESKLGIKDQSWDSVEPMGMYRDMEAWQ